MSEFLTARMGRVFYWTVEYDTTERYMASVSEVVLNEDGTGWLIVDKGERQLLQEYVQRTAEGRRPRLRLGFQKEISLDLKYDGFVYIAADLEEFVDDPEAILRVDVAFRWWELQLRLDSP